MSAVAVEKPKTPVAKILRPERLPAGWFWHNNMSVTNRTVDKDNNLFIVYLTSGIKGEEDVANHIRQVVKARKSAQIQKEIE